MHFLQSESFGLPFLPQSHDWMQLDLELPPHKHRAMQRSTGPHDGHPHFICLTMQSLHLLPSYGQAWAGDTISHNSSSTIGTIVVADGFFSIYAKSQISPCYGVFLLVHQKSEFTVPSWPIPEQVFIFVR
ncbi:hypothetical protein TIFTF001_006039 [Ficus carica]|uniref:Uncharacterized protein n=1 Tax=Ficus carica TaxID=3494 RepID=A0AA88D059_FICCA|nr:hypothetical protein TIFTF001_006039 [Ficus carica]